MGDRVPARTRGPVPDPCSLWTGVYLSPGKKTEAGTYEKCPCSMKHGSVTARRTFQLAGVGAEATAIREVDEKKAPGERAERLP